MAASDKGTSGKAPPTEATNFIRDIIQADLGAGRAGRVITRFPPEPNGYPHIGHAKSICLNFGLARDFGGVCHLRFDDTNPTTEDMEYVEAIQRDVRWLGFDWADKLFFASDYYEKLYAYAVQLIEAGKAYVCSLSEEDIRKYRGTAYEPGVPSPYRGRSVAENLDLFRRMRAGEFPDGAHVLRGKIDMASPNLKMRDWPFYRIRHAHHYRTGDAWCIYPLYDFAHCLSDLVEGITHSVCTLEFENNRELYDWIVDAVLEKSPGAPRPHQYEFARLEVSSVMTSKRKLLQLVESGKVSGWDDPRMPTLAGLRRRGYTPSALRAFCDRVGVAKNNSTVDFALLEHVLREDLNLASPRVLAVLRPLRVVIDTWSEGQVEEIDAPYWPADVPREGTRKLPMSREIYIDRDDFLEDPPKDFHRLAPGREVRLRHAYVIRCEKVVKDEAGEIVELRCSHDAATRGADPAGRKVKGTIQWVSAAHAAEAEVRLYDRLFSTDSPGSTGDFLQELNPGSLVSVRARVEPSLAHAQPGDHVQFERLGFFFADPVDSRPGAPVWNRTVALKDTWAKIVKAEGAAKPVAPEKAAPRPAPEKTAEAPLGADAQRLRDAHGLPDDDARILAGDPAVAAFFAEALAAHAEFTMGLRPAEPGSAPNPGGAKSVARWIVNEVLGVARAGGIAALPFRGAAVGQLCALVDAGTLSGKIAKEVFAEMVRGGGSPQEIVEKKGLRQISDTGAIEAAVAAVLAENADAVARYRGGNANLLGAFVGMVMKKTGGKANPKLVNELLRARLDGG
jgi:glutaminyl-tRNA synthetase